jgi:hypothetical protein
MCCDLGGIEILEKDQERKKFQYVIRISRALRIVTSGVFLSTFLIRLRVWLVSFSHSTLCNCAEYL